MDYPRQPDQTDIAHHMPFLRELAATRPCILEIGIGHGNGSTRAFADGIQENALVDRCHVCVDRRIAYPLDFPENDYTYFVHGDSRHTRTVSMACAFLKARTPDLIYIDTDHTREQLWLELMLWNQLSHYKLTTWVFHDTWMNGQYNKMTDAIKDFCHVYRQWQFIDHSRESHGLGLMVGV